MLEIRAAELYSMEEALQRLAAVVGRVPDWRTLMSFLPEGLGEGVVGRSAVAATFAATLEMVRSGTIEVRQDVAFGPIYLRSRGEAQ